MSVENAQVTHSPSLKQLLAPFAESIYAKTTALNTLDLDKKTKARFLESISDDIKKCSNFVRPLVSDKAQQETAKYKFNLFDMNWHDMKKEDRKTFHFEHVNTVLSLRIACCEAFSSETILQILLSKIKVAWVLKDEDKRLSANGYKSKRPDNAYEHVGIKLVEPEHISTRWPK
jgi:hypothetical protein